MNLPAARSGFYRILKLTTLLSEQDIGRIAVLINLKAGRREEKTRIQTS